MVGTSGGIPILGILLPHFRKHFICIYDFCGDFHIIVTLTRMLA